MNAIISIILPTYNSASRGNGLYLKKAIESVLNQSYSEFELIIINDGSIDKTEEFCKHYNDRRIKYIYQENKGPSAARNTGIKESTGCYVTFLDDDDFFYNDKLLEQKKYLEINNADVVYCFANRIDENDIKTSNLNYKNSGSLLEILLSGNVINSPASIMLTRNAIEKVGFFKEHLRASEDWDYWLRLSVFFSFHCLESPLVGYRIHSSYQLNRDREKMELYDFIVLMENLISLGIKEKDKHLLNLYKRFAKIDYGVRDYKLFQQNYKIATIYGSHNLEWKIKYWLSYFPPLLEFIYSVYTKINK